MKILIVDDQLPNRMIAKFHVESEGHQCLEAENGKDAIEKFLKYKPDFVLMDIVMPEMDGYEAAYYIKNYATDRHIPIIFLTAQHDEKSLLKCLECGGDDYLIKPINGTLLKAKIRAHSRTLELTQQIQQKNEELSRVYSNLTREHEMGRHVLNHTLERNVKDCPIVQQYLSSLSTFNGDLCLTADNPNGGLYVFLGDFTGHGLAAAIGTIPLSQLFFSMCENGDSVSEIVFAMNQTLKQFLPEHMFCAATMVHLYERGDSAHIWTGGLPDAYIVRSGKGIVQTVKSRNMPLGILQDDSFNSEPGFFRFEKDDRFIMFSDGILEARSAIDENMFGEARIQEVLQSGSADIFQHLIKAHNEFVGEERQSDDISLVEVRAAPYESQFLRDLNFSFDGNKAFIPWRFSLMLEPQRLKSIDVVNAVIGLLPSTLRVSYRFDAFRTVLSELYSNSLEHGLLELSSRIKEEPEGFGRYYELRQERLAALQSGFINLSISTFLEQDKIKVRLCLEDSGPGFDYLAAEKNQSSIKPWGRGIALIKSLSEKVTYLSQGEKVEVVLLIS